MTPKELVAVQHQVAVIIGLMQGLNLEGALVLMQQAGKQSKFTDPIMWAKTHRAHERMTTLINAALTFQRTVEKIRDEIPNRPKVLLS